MKSGKLLVIGCIAALMCMTVAYQKGIAAGEKQIAPAKIAVVDITKVLQNSSKHKAWQEKMSKQEESMKEEFKKAQAELETLQKGMSVYKAGSVDYNKAMVDFMEKKGQLEAKDKFYQDRVSLEMQQWTEDLYKKMLDVVSQIAQKKGLDIILAQEELDLPAPSLRDFMLSIRTKKVLYSASQVDITVEVLTALDEAK